MDCSLLGCSVHGISQARILKQVATSSPKDLPDPGIELLSPASPFIGKHILHHWAARGNQNNKPKADHIFMEIAKIIVIIKTLKM